MNIGASSATAVAQQVAVATNAANALGTAVTAVAGIETTGNRQNASGRQGADGDAGFQLPSVEQTGETSASDAGNTVHVATRPIDLPPIAVFDPTHADADAQDVVQQPNVSPERDFIELTLARRAYEASLATVNTADQTLGTVLDHRF